MNSKQILPKLSIFDQVKFFESIAHRRFQRFYSQLVQLKVDLINFVGDRQGSELTDILSFKAPLISSSECQVVLSQVQDKALKQLTGLIYLYPIKIKHGANNAQPLILPVIILNLLLVGLGLPGGIRPKSLRWEPNICLSRANWCLLRRRCPM